MNVYQIVGTLAGAFIFAFIIKICWVRLVENFGPIGGWMAGGFIVGTVFLLNHAVGLIFQTGPVWIDMAFAAGFGGYASSLYEGDSIQKSLPRLFDALIGGVLGGALLFCMFQYAPPYPF